jgi:hypothetical protein
MFLLPLSATETSASARRTELISDSNAEKGMSLGADASQRNAGRAAPGYSRRSSDALV